MCTAQTVYITNPKKPSLQKKEEKKQKEITRIPTKCASDYIQDSKSLLNGQ